MKLLQGVIPVLMTPFTEQEELNERVLRQYISRYLNAGVHGLFCLGTNGEFFSLTQEEKIRIIEIAVQEAKGKVPIYAGTGGITTREAVQLSEKMEELGADALSVITPYFLPLSQAELIGHYRSIAASVSLPIVLYNFPARTGLTIEPETVAELAKIPNIVAIKDSSGNFELIERYIAAAGPDFAVLAGSDALLLKTLQAGGKGGVSGSANVLPELMVSIYTHWQNGNIEAAEAAQSLLQPLSQVYRMATLPSVFKEAMNRMGLEAGPCRAPIGPLPAEASDELDRVLRHYRELGYIQGEPNES
ncbi:4-hydroxy-tetrahydrodipicolinate synthase [Paenibacillus sp. N4]|uniref:4-hydroxy-tetrahydrodipicolinate synthase n=1 Tax=Paenibacillus vietnamensis TaxID=2590547 RepID=UPI001CD18E2F|nr:4-hydroxy-tetrahydrodipicolinate synthase [Paenibacillus vietnamensis]MCA0755600.1 4-hydroxy-tetrahydrodipicolinate synthase [Paenibacillus vietnamensis]